MGRYKTKTSTKKIDNKYVFLFYEKKVGKKWKREKMRMSRGQAELLFRKIVNDKDFLNEIISILFSRVRPWWVFEKIKKERK